MFERQSRMLGAALAGVFGAAVVTACFYILLVAVSFFVVIPGVGSVVLIASLLLGVFTFTFVVAFRKFVGMFSA